MVQAGVGSVLNFAPRVLTVPPEVLLRYVDLSIELQVMSFYLSHRDHARARRPRGRRFRTPSASARPNPAEPHPAFAHGDPGLAYGPADRHPGREGFGPPRGRRVALRVACPHKELCEPLSVVVVGLEQHQVPSTCSNGWRSPRRTSARWSRRCATGPTWPRSWCCRPACGPSSTPWWSGSTRGSTDLQEFLAGMAGTPVDALEDQLDGALRRRRDRPPLRGRGRVCARASSGRPRSSARSDGRSRRPRPSGPRGRCCRGCSGTPCRRAAGPVRRPPSPRGPRRCPTWPWSWPRRGWVDPWPGATCSWSGRARWGRGWWTRSAGAATSAQVVVANRTVDRAVDAGRPRGGTGPSASTVSPSALARPTSSSSPPVRRCRSSTPSCRRSVAPGARPAGRRPSVVVDLGVPRNVDPAVAALAGVDLLDMDDLTEHAERRHGGRRAELSAAQEIVARRSSATGPTSGPGGRRRSSRAARPDGGDAPGRARAPPGPAGSSSTSGSGRRWSRSCATCWPSCCISPTVALKEAAGTPRGERLVEALRTLFDL